MKSLRMCTLLLALCGIGLLNFNVEAAQPNSGGSLVIIFNQTPRNLNPVIQSGTATALIAAQLYASPFRMDKDYKPQPYLAKSYKLSDDELTLQIDLRENATFHDGRPITSKDLAFSIEMLKKYHPFTSMFEPVEKVETPNDNIAVIKLKKPHPAILTAMSLPGLCPILPKHIYDDGQELPKHSRNSDPIGSGPFKLVEFKAGQHIVFQRYEKFYLPERPYLEKVIIKIINDDASRIIAMETGEGHFMETTSFHNIERLKRASSVRISEGGSEALGHLTWLAFNLLRKPYDDPRVRQAISYAIDREFISKKLQSGLTIPATGPIAPGLPFYSKSVNTYPVDLKKAESILEGAGLKKDQNGVRMTMSLDYLPVEPDQQKNVAEYLKSQLKKIGIDVQLRSSPDMPTWLNRVSNWDYDATLDSVYCWADPVIGVHRTYLSSNIRKGIPWSNTHNYSNPKVDEILSIAGSETDVKKRGELYEQFQKIVVDEAPLVYITAIKRYRALDKRLVNAPAGVWGQLSPMDETYFEKSAK